MLNSSAPATFSWIQSGCIAACFAFSVPNTDVALHLG